MVTPSGYLRIVRMSAWYDLVVTAGFATPWTFLAIHTGINALTAQMGMTARFPAFDPTQMLMANLLGSIVIVWSVLRLRDTQVRYGRYDVIGRVLFAAWELFALLHGAHPLIYFFFVNEVGFAVAQLVPIKNPVRPISGQAMNTSGLSASP